MLSDARIRAAKPKPAGYRLADAGGLHLFITPKGGKAWRFRFDLGGKEQTLSLGSYPDVGLADARSRRDDARRRLAAGEDPRVAPPAAPVLPTLADITHRWHAINAPRWKPHHATDVLNGLETEILATLGKTPIRDVTAPADIERLRILERRGAIDTAHRIRGRLADVFAFAIGEGVAEHNPAEAIRAAMSPMPRGGHRPAATTLDAARAALAAAEAIPAYPITRLALRFLALTATRPGEVAGALWQEIEGDVWRIPAERMKAGREHFVPLSRQAAEVVAAVRPLSGRMPYIFPSARSARAGLSANALNVMLRRADLSGIQTPHGWRATFSTVMNERFPADRLIIDLMLAHTEARGAVEAAYNRAQHTDRRRELAQTWADLLLDGMAPASDLVGMRRK